MVTKFDNAINSVLINGKIVQQRIAIYLYVRGTIPFHLFWITHPTIRQLGALSKRDFSIILELCVKWPMAICQKCTLASMMMPFWKLTVNHARFSFFYTNFFFAFPQCNNNIAKSENFFMEKQKNIFIFSLSNLNWCILEFNLKVFNLSTICYATIGENSEYM